MFTADNARSMDKNDLDERIEYAVKNHRQYNGAYLRVYHDDWFCHSIQHELEKRGFVNVQVPGIVLSGDVYFEWVE